METFCPLLPIRTECFFIRRGYYPFGSQEIIVRVDPFVKRFLPIIMMEKTEVLFMEFVISHSQNPNVCNQINEKLPPQYKCTVIDVGAPQKEMPVLTARIGFEEITEIITIWYENSVDETVDRFVKELDNFINGNTMVSEYLADQLLLPLVIKSKGLFKIPSLTEHSNHFITNAMVIEHLIGQEDKKRISIKQIDGQYDVRVY
jgi:RNA 3'-terminal phosphate cyclase